MKFHLFLHLKKHLAGKNFDDDDDVQEEVMTWFKAVAYPGIFSGGRGVQQIQLSTEERDHGDLGAVAPYSGVLEAAVIWYKKFHFVW